LKEIENTSLTVCRTKEGILIDKSKVQPRIILPEQFRFTEFERLHSLSHQGSNATIQTILSRYMWPKIKAGIRKWCKHCQNCQTSKIHRYTKTPQGSLPYKGKFKVVHIDIVGPLPLNKGKKISVHYYKSSYIEGRSSTTTRNKCRIDLFGISTKLVIEIWCP